MMSALEKCPLDSGVCFESVLCKLCDYPVGSLVNSTISPFPVVIKCVYSILQ